jgi:hypothetical protein
MQAALATILLGLVNFFTVRPDIFLELLFSAVAIMMIAGGLGRIRPRKRSGRSGRR